MAKLADKDRDALIGALEKCQAIQDDVRGQLLAHLPGDIRASLAQPPGNRPFAFSLVTRCAGFPRGLHRLGLAVRFFEGADSYAMLDMGPVFLRVALSSAIWLIARRDPEALTSFVAVNLGAEMPKAPDGRELRDIAHLATAVVALAHEQDRLDQAFIEQLALQADDDATIRDFLNEIAEYWLPYGRPRRRETTATPPAGTTVAAPDKTPVEKPTLERTEHAQTGASQRSDIASGEPPPLDIPRGAPGRLSLVLDRSRQWSDLTALCTHSDHHLAFLIHGHAHQSLHLFSGRVQDFLLSHDCPRLHDVFQVPLRTHYTRANDASVWAVHMRRALGAGQSLGMPGLIKKKTNHEAIMLIVGNGVLRGLDSDEERALVDFLGRDLPTWVAQAAPNNPVRVLVPIEYKEPTADDSALLKNVRQALSNPDSPLHLKELRTVEFPPWTDVAWTLLAEYPAAPVDFLARAQALYQHLTRRVPPPTFADLAHALDTLAQEIDGAADV